MIVWPNDWKLEPVSFLRDIEFVKANTDERSTETWSIRNDMIRGRWFGMELTNGVVEEEPCREITEHENLYELFECEE